MKSKVSALLMMIVLAGHAQAAPVAPPDAVVKPLMARYQIPGMAVAVSVNGETHFWHYGVASKETRKPVDENTLFEIGSLSKTFTATLASKAQQDGKLDFSAPASQYLPALKGSAFDNVTLLNLATHTAGTPLFVPDAVKNTTQLMDWYRAWQPEKPVGTERVYSNLGIGLLGMITAKALDKPFSEAMEQGLLRDFGMTHTFINVPVAAMDDYAQGYNKDDKPVRVTPGPLDAESYGLKSGSADLLRYLQIQLGEQEVAPGWRQAINATHNGYYRSGEFTPLKESANGADDPPRQRRFDLLVLHQPGGIAVQLIKHFMQRIKGIVANEARQPDGARVSDHLVIHRPIVKPRLLAVKEAHRIIR